MRLARSIWSMIVFLVGFAVLIVLVSHHFLIPAILASHDATPAEKRHIQAAATLLLAVVLFILLVGVMLLLRVKRFFLSAPTESRQKTEYIDAWSEAGRRAKPDTDDQ